MARLTVSGLEDVQALIQNAQDKAQPAAEAAVKAGAQVAVEAMQKTAPVLTGGLKAHIQAKGPMYGAGDGYYCEVFPTGTKPNGRKTERYETVGFVQEYGTSSMAAQPWMRPAVEASRDQVQKTMEETFKGGLGL